MLCILRAVMPSSGCLPPACLPHRFKQLRAVLLTDSPATAHAGQLAGCYAVHQLGPSWQPAADVAARICSLLHVAPLPLAGGSEAAPALAAVLAAAGQSQPPAAAFGAASEEDAEEGDEVIDMVLLALDAANAPVLSGDGEQASSGALAPPGAGSSAALSSGLAALEWADDLVRLLNQEPGFRETVLLTLVVGPGPCAEQPLLVQDQPLLQPGQPQPYGSAAPAAAAGTAASAAALERATAVAAAPDCLPVQRPAQSYQLAGLDRVSVDAHSPAVVVHRLPAVIRQAVTGSRVPVSYFIKAAVLPLAGLQLHGPAQSSWCAQPTNPAGAPSSSCQGGLGPPAGYGTHCLAGCSGLHSGRAAAAGGLLQAGTSPKIWGINLHCACSAAS